MTRIVRDCSYAATTFADSYDQCNAIRRYAIKDRTSTLIYLHNRRIDDIEDNVHLYIYIVTYGECIAFAIKH